MSIQEELRENIRQQLSMKTTGKLRTRADTSSDMNLMLNEFFLKTFKDESLKILRIPTIF